jgi:hypothetical protein
MFAHNSKSDHRSYIIMYLKVLKTIKKVLPLHCNSQKKLFLIFPFKISYILWENVILFWQGGLRNNAFIIETIQYWGISYCLWNTNYARDKLYYIHKPYYDQYKVCNSQNSDVMFYILSFKNCQISTWNHKLPANNAGNFLLYLNITIFRAQLEDFNRTNCNLSETRHFNSC